MEIRPLLRFAALLMVLGAGLYLLANRHATSGPPAAGRAAALRSLSQSATGASAQSGATTDLSKPVTPVAVNLAALPAPPAEGAPPVGYQGEAGRPESPASAAELVALRAAALELPASQVVQEPENGSPLAAPSLEDFFEGPDINDCCSYGAAVPPDPELAVGPGHVIAAVNESFAIYGRDGQTLVGPTTFRAFLGIADGCGSGEQLFDPNALYDEAAGRFVLAMDSSGHSYCVAVSAGPDPTTNWHIYRFVLAGSGLFFDFPQAGIGRDAIFLGGNLFAGFSFDEARVWAFDKWAMYAGQPAAGRAQSLPGTEDSPQPMALHGFAQGQWPSGGPHYILSETYFNGDNYSVYAWNNPFSSNTFYKVGTFDLQQVTGVNGGFPLDVPQPGAGNDPVQANDFRLLDAEYRLGRIWTVQTIGCNPGAGTVNCLRWAQINPTNAQVEQAGLYASNGRYRFFGDLALNGCGDMALGYTRVDPADATYGYPSVWAAGRRADDPPGQLSAELPIRQSDTPYTAFDAPPHRWGDYTGLTSDPNGRDLWYIGQYSKNAANGFGRWGTVIGRLAFEPAAGLPAGEPAGFSFFQYLPAIFAPAGC
ncbi:MAG: hypothetical protein ACRDHL_07735 [Candidatus Promineifilaceae bacterium]